MFFHKLVLENFRSHKATEFKFGKINLIRGANNAGKSSVAQSVAFLLTGTCDGLDERGSGGDRLIRVGAKQSAITADIGTPDAVNLSLTRTRSVRGSDVLAKIGNRQYTGKQLEDWLDKKGWNKQVLSAALRGSRFLSLTPAEQKELLADILRPESVGVPGEMQEAMKACFDGFTIDLVDLEGARDLEERAIKLRAECTAALRELGEPEAVEERPKDAPTSAQVEQRLNGLRSEQNSLTREKEKLENAWADRSQKRKQIPLYIAALKAKILSAADEKNYLEAIEHESDVTKAGHTLAEINATIQGLRQEIANVKKKEGKCPTCGHETDTDELVRRFQESIGKLESRIPTLQNMLDRYPNVADARPALRAHREAVTDLERMQKELAELGDAKADVPDVKGIAEKIAELDDRIQKGQVVLGGIASQEEARRNYLAVLQRRQACETKRTAADALAKYCGPGGIQAQMSAGKLAPFVDAINAVLGKFGYSMKLSLDPYEIIVNSIGVASLSESEQWRFSTAFQCALAVATDLKLVVLDRGDILVGKNRAALGEVLFSVGLDQIFLLASTETKTKMPESVTVFDLELNANGETVVQKGG